MRLSIRFADYVNFLKAYSNVPVTLNRLTLPFGIITDSKESDTLLVGHILDELASRFKNDQPVDCLDVAVAAWELGHDAAGSFIDEAPYIIYRMSRETGAAGIN